MTSYTRTGSSMSNISPDSPFEQAIKLFIKSLTVKEQTSSKNPFLNELKPQIQDSVQAQVEGAQSQISAASLTQFLEDSISKKRGSHTSSVLSRVHVFIEPLKNLMALCEKNLQAAPFGVSVAFTGARIVLDLALKMDFLDIVVDGMGEIGISLQCYEKLADAFETSPDVQSLLVASYDRIIRFWYKISGLLSSKLAKSVMKHMITKPIDQEIKTALEGLRLDGQRLNLLSSATTAQQTKRDREIAERQAVTKWIVSDSPVDVRVHLKDQVARHQEGTCRWILEDHRFHNWMKSKENPILWYNAKPGSGKSVLAASIIQHLKAKGKKVAHFFYSFNDPRRKLGISGLRCLALQLSNFLDVLPETLVDRYQTERANHAQGLLDPHTAALVVHELLRCDEVYIIVDGLDECRDETGILPVYHRLISMRSYSDVKWMFTSRDHNNVRSMMTSLRAVEVTAETDTISNDIHTYFIERHPAQSEVIKEWTDGEDNFLYAKLICDTMAGEGLTTVAEIKDALNSYPKDLNDYYMRALVKLSKKSVKEQDMARRTFLVLIGALQSITLHELSDLLAVTPGAVDYDNERIPSRQVIKDLCSPLMIFCNPKEGDAPDNPIIGLCHKTVEDFFMQDPEQISPDTGFTPELLQYFVKPQLVHERLGLDCLAYLEYARYQKPGLQLHKILSRPVAKEHAFLPYAATFWALHLSIIDSSQRVVGPVQEFLESPAFWTCLSVQAYVSPYLFGRYSSCRHGGGRYFKMGVKAKSQSEDGEVGLPLPHWIDTSEEGRSLFESLCLFAEDWREVLLTCPRGLNLCPRLIQSERSCHLVPLKAAKTMKVAYLEDKLRASCPTGRAVLLDMAFHGRTLWASLLCFKTEESLERLRVPLFSKQSPQSDLLQPLINPEELLKRNNFLVGGEGEAEAVQAWMIDPHTLSLRQTTHKASIEQKTPLAFSKEHIGRKKGSWETMSTQDIPPLGLKTMPFRIFHMACVAERPPIQLHRDAQAPQDDEDSDEDSNDDSASEASEPSEDEAESDDDSSVANSSTSEAADNGSTRATTDTDYDDSEADDGLMTDCLIVAPIEGQPSWFPWSSPRRVWSRVICAPHPVLPILVLSHTAREIEVIDLFKRTKTSKHLPEVADLDEEPLASLRELRFSPCGDYLHFLSISFFAQKVSTEARITLSTFSFNPDGGSDRTLLKECQARKCTYVFGEALKDMPIPLALTHWSTSEVIVALPPLTCDPRVLKISLPRVSVESGQITASEEAKSVWTLCDPIYFPTSTPRRSARLMYRGAKAEDQDSSYIFLALDNCASGTAKSEPDPATISLRDVASAKEAQTEAVVSPPVVLRWKVAPGDGWRVWDDAVDGEASDLKRGLPVEKLLQGNFVDADKSFNVSIRGGLNWRRKGHLSCATF